MRLTARNIAKAMEVKFYHGKMCRMGHGTLRYTSTGHCIKCNSTSSMESYTNNKERWRANHRAWAERNPGRIAAKNRKFHLKRFTPPWADLEEILAIYLEAARLSKETGIRHAVDHIVPLRGPTVSGLHVRDNLQILTFQENAKKNNKFEG